MTRGGWTLAGVMLLAAAAVTWASQRGIGLPQPARQPVSVREGSVRAPLSGAGHHRTRYFVGGGMFAGK